MPLPTRPAMSAPPDPLLPILDRALASAALRAGEHLVCHPGCSPCCHGVFEISALDAQRLREGLEAASSDLSQRLSVRIADARNRLAPFFPGDVATGLLGGDEDAIELFEEAFHDAPCPVLDPATQTCDLYAHRPVLCRTFGPPIRNRHDDPAEGLAICELCFTRASKDEILAAEMDSSFRPLQHALEQQCMQDHPGTGPTLVAFAFQAGESEAR